MSPSRLICLALSLLLITMAAGLVADETPPKPLHMVGDHWTAWDPPTSLPDDTEVYIVQRGDTLWDLAGQFYGDPYLWPQLWERNSYILDAHWIYPGDPLVVGVEVTPVEDVLSPDDGDTADQEQGDDSLGLDSTATPPIQLGSESDIYCSGFIGPVDQAFDFEIIGSEYSGSSYDDPLRAGYGSRQGYIMDLSLGDIVYVSGGREAGLMPGSVFTVVETKGIVKHPVSKETIGEHYRYNGRVRILSAQDTTAIAEISHSCHPISVGAVLMPFTPEPVPLARYSGMIGLNDPVTEEALIDAPIIVLSDAGVLSLGQGHVVYIDRGAEDVSPGDLFTIYRPTPSEIPPLIIGELAVLSVGETTAVAKILDSRQVVHVGDRLSP
ncbi:MAG: LysM peptidoglycan-binding domain-containing protein, partial [Thermoanaerobaculia bacterium]